MKINPPLDKVAILPIFPADMIGHIIVPDQAKDRCKQGIVKFVGPDCKFLKPGDYVIFGAYDGSIVKLEDELYIFMREEFVQCTIDNIPDLDIPGLYLKDSEGYFQASYTMVIDMLTMGIQGSAWFGEFQKGVKSHKPKITDYDTMRK